MAVDHVILREFYVERTVPFFTDYLRRYTDAPFLVRVDGGRPGRFLRAGALPAYRDVPNPDWKLLVWDETSGRPRMPQGTVGFRWGEGDAGKWNLEPVDGLDGEALAPVLSFADAHDERLSVTFDDLSNEQPIERRVPVRYVETEEGRVAVATAFDLLLAQFGVAACGDEPVDYADAEALYTPAWQEARTGVHRDTLVRFAREWATNAEKTEGRNLIIIGAGIEPLVPQQPDLPRRHHRADVLRARGGQRRRPGALRGSGKARAATPRGRPSPSARDWGAAAPAAERPQLHYVHTDQWRYEHGFTDYHTVRSNDGRRAPAEHTIDEQARAVRNGWLPFYPQFDKQPLDWCAKPSAAGAVDRPGGRPARRRPAQGRQPEIRGRGSGCAGELAARMVHLARQRLDGQRQGTRVFSEALSGHAQQRHRARTLARATPCTKSPGTRRHR